ncbi:MAG: nucleotidyltransferase domain-containing protein [Nitrososphaerales archaeon]
MSSTRILSSQERKSIRKICEDLEVGEIVGICAYGSRVAGYFTEESDYDLILVIDGFKQIIRYKYLEGDLDVSILIVDLKAFREDASKSYLGEFVAGRLLNIYEPIRGSKIFRDAESTYKGRIMDETVNQLFSSFGEFCFELRIPLEFFLFEKLRKRASVYPPALYSYVKTYSGLNSERNLSATLEMFSQKAIEADKNHKAISDGRFFMPSRSYNGWQSSRFVSVVKEARRGITQYAVHGLAGRVSPKVIGKEILSKIGRHRSVADIPEPLNKPKNLLSLGEGFLVTDEDDWLRRLIELLGMQSDIDVKVLSLGEPYSSSKLYKLGSGSDLKELVIKKFGDPWSLKWTLLSIWAGPAQRRMKILPFERLSNEYRAMKDLHKAGINVPKTICVVLDEKILVKSFIRGEDLGEVVSSILQGKDTDLEPLREYGRIMAKAHSLGFGLGDTKPSNAVVSVDGVYLTDLEQTVLGGDITWDIAEFSYYSSKLTMNTEGVKKVIESFLTGYLEAGSSKVVAAAGEAKYLKPFQPFIAPKTASFIRRELQLNRSPG